ncbi:MAG: cell division protein ZapA [Clostridia bacterium]|nr:cell division protein ZapA [Clostridia bacterium]
MADKSKVTVRIFGTDYILCGSESEEYINNVAFNVDKMMREVAKNPLLKPLQIAVLTSCNLCDENIKLKEQMDLAEQEKSKYAAAGSKYKGIAEENKFLKDEIANLKEEIADLKIRLAQKR